MRESSWQSRIPRVAVGVLAVWMLAGGAGLADTVTVYDDRARFEAATGATALAIPLAEELLPAFGLLGWGCDALLAIPFGTNGLVVTAPASLPDPSLPGIANPVCVADPGVPDLHMVPLSPTILGNGEDDFELVFDEPVHAVGLEFMTNFSAVETLSFRDDLGETFFAVSVGPLTRTSAFEFVGFESATPIRSVFVDTLNGAVQNEGISAILASDVLDEDRDGHLPPADCDNSSARVFPGADEVFDGLDNDCDGDVDEDLDRDGDGIPDFADRCDDTPAGSGVDPDGCESCSGRDDLDGDGFPAPADCDDTDPAVHPSASDTCNGVDDDCDGVVDEGYDQDGDGFSPCAGDCEDADPAIHPAAFEWPGNTTDENCDGVLACDPCADWRDHGEFIQCVVREIRAAGRPVGSAKVVVSASRSRVGKKGHLPAECEPQKDKHKDKHKEKGKHKDKARTEDGKRSKDG